MDEADLLKFATAWAKVFVPEMVPLIPALVTDFDTLAKAKAAVQPAFTQIENDQPAFLEAVEEIPAIEQLLPELAKAARDFESAAAIWAKYKAKLAAAEAAK